MGTVLITQTLTGMSNDIPQNIPLIMVHSNNDAYVASLGS